MSFAIGSLGLFLENFGLKRLDSERGRPDEVEFESGHGAPVYEQGPQTRMRRSPVRAIATLTWEEGPDKVYGSVENVSPRGCLVTTESTIDEGTEVDIEIRTVGDDTDLEVPALGVVRHATEQDGRRAYGIEFREVEDETALKRLYNT